MDEWSRRDALGLTAGWGLVALGAGGCSSSRAAGHDLRGEPPTPGGAATISAPRALAAVSAVPPGGALDVSAAAGQPAYLVGRGDSMRLLSGICTHQSCLVSWRDDRNRFRCPCHGGIYDSQGAVMSGPPPRALDELPTQIVSGVVYLASDTPGAPR